jgi:hypothetical protein
MIKLPNTNIERVKQCKTFKIGIVVDDHLLWNEHVDSVIEKVSKELGMLRRLKQVVPK